MLLCLYYLHHPHPPTHTLDPHYLIADTVGFIPYNFFHSKQMHIPRQGIHVKELSMFVHSPITEYFTTLFWLVKKDFSSEHNIDIFIL